MREGEYEQHSSQAESPNRPPIQQLCTFALQLACPKHATAVGSCKVQRIVKKQ
jgi:hypothetical protein